MVDAGQDWDVADILSSQGTERYAAILLNQPILPPFKELIERIWSNASLKLCADGGANRLFDAYGDGCSLPHEVRGDLDSLRPDVQQFLESKDVTIVRAASEYATDLQKCVLAVEEYEEENTIGKDRQLVVVILGGLSGRLDQTMHTLHVLCQLAKTGSPTDEAPSVRRGKKNYGLNSSDYVQLERRNKTIAISENSVAWLLTKGKHVIRIDLSLFGPTCGLLPFTAKVSEDDASGTRTWTKGLRWNLEGEACAVGGFLSTSNHLQDETVEVETDREIIWTMEIRGSEH